jgi:type II secretory pathway pseudopilin PulG
MEGTAGNQRRASILEILGVWLHVWTAPRDVEIPPVPWRKLALWTGVGAVVLGIVLAIMIPRINDGIAERNAKAAAEQAHAQKLNRERVIKLQQPRTGEFAALKPAGSASAAEVESARQQLVTSVETAITTDAQKRGAAGEISKIQGPTTCTHSAGTPTTGPIGVFDCYTIVRHVPKVQTNVAGSIGYPFRAVLNYSTFTYAFCRTEQFPGEQLIPDPRTVVQLPAACRTK